MPAFASLPTSSRIAVVAGWGEALSLIGYAVSIVAFESTGSTAGISGSGADLAPSVLVALYIAFAGLVLLTSTALMRGSRHALAPFLLAQAFGIVIAQALLGADGTRAAGVVVLLVAVGAGAAALMPASRQVLR